MSGRLTWSRSSRCGKCELAVEEDGAGILPQEHRAEVLGRDGVWGVRTTASRVVARALAELLSRGLVQVWTLVSGHVPVPIGTKAEAICVAERSPELVNVSDGIVSIGPGDQA